MALSTLRKHQKKLLAILAVLAMIAFSFDIVIQNFQPTRVARFDPIARVYGQEIYPQHVDLLRQERAIANRFLALAWSAIGDTFALRIWDSEFFGATDRDAILEAIALMHEADRLGITYTDEMVTDFIVQITGGRLTTEHFRRIVTRLGISQYTLYAALKNQLRIRLVEGLYYGRSRRLANRNRVTPLDAWSLYRRVNEQVTFEAVPVPVEQFADMVDAPTDGELRALYDKYKDQIPVPDQPEPGFRRPPRVHLQYASIGVDNLVAELEKSVTEEEIRRYYEENKELYRIDEPEEETEGQQEAPEQEPAAQDQPSDSKSASDKEQPGEPEKDGQSPEPKPQQKPAKRPDSDRKSSSDGQTQPEKPSTASSGQGQANREGSPGSPSKKEQPEQERQQEEQPTKKDQSSLLRARATTLANVAQQAAASPASENQPKAGPDKKKTDEGADRKDAQSEKPTQASSEAAGADQENNETAEDGKEPEANQDQESGDESAQEEEPPARYQPLDEVKDAIRRILAERKAEQEAQRRLEELAQKVREYVIEKYLPAREEFERAGGEESGRKFSPPPFPDLKPLAEKLGLELQEIDELSFLNVDAVGPLRDAREVVGGIPSGAAFDELFVPDPDGEATGQAEILEVRILRDLRGTYYAVWIRERKDAETPPFEKIRDEVELAYRIEKARPLAEKRAKELAAELRRAGGDVKKLVSENEGLTTISAGPMTLWRRRLGMFGPQGIEPVEIPGIRYAGNRLRQTLLELEPTQVAVAPDAPVRTYYVLVVKEKVAAKLEDFAREMLLYLELAQRMHDQQWVRARRAALWRPGVIELLDEQPASQVPADAQARL